MTGYDKQIDCSLSPEATELAKALERELADKHGPLIADEDLRAALGYRSMDAFRQALVRKVVPVPVFAIPQRRGKFALVRDVAIWLAIQRQSAVTQQTKKTDSE